MSTFTSLQLSEEVLQALDTLGYHKPTEIQDLIIPQLLEHNKDCIGLAQTGTGKTAAFCLPLIDLVDEDSSLIQGLILAPTRELARQIAAEITSFTKFKPSVRSYVVYGGTAISQQIKDIKSKKPQIIVATPGRLIDLINRKVIKAKSVSHLVLDEADEMLNMGFQEDIDYILKFTPPERKIWLFSATMPKEIKKIVDGYMNHPIEATATKDVSKGGNLLHQYVMVERKNRVAALKRFIDADPNMYGVVFCRTRRDTQELAEQLTRGGYRADAIHGDLSQAQRESVMKKFRSRMIQLLIATDVAARGIDVDDLTHVIHYALPDTAEYYTHRAGRTARAGRAGASIIFISPRDKRKMTSLLRHMDINLERINVPTYGQVLENRISGWANNFVKADIENLDDKLYATVHGWLKDLSKEEIIKRLVAVEMSHIAEKKNQGDLNAAEGEKRRDKGKKEKSRKGEARRGAPQERTRGRSGRTVKMFINLGKMDNMNTSDILKFIAHHGDINKKYIGEVRLQKMNATFDLDHKALKVLSSNFKEVTHRGRPIRCNPK